MIEEKFECPVCGEKLHFVEKSVGKICNSFQNHLKIVDDLKPKKVEEETFKLYMRLLRKHKKEKDGY